MEVQHDDPELREIESDPNYNGGMERAKVRAYRKVMNIVRNVLNETQLYSFKGLKYEKLQGNRSHQHSLRLNDQWRLIVEINEQTGPNNNICVVKKIEDYH